MGPHAVCCLRLGLACALLGCAGGGTPDPGPPPPVFVRARGVWTPEELHRDVAECIDRVHPQLAADPALRAAPSGAAGAALHEQLVACMGERGWRTGASARSEEWSE